MNNKLRLALLAAIVSVGVMAVCFTSAQADECHPNPVSYNPGPVAPSSWRIETPLDEERTIQFWTFNGEYGKLAESTITSQWVETDHDWSSTCGTQAPGVLRALTTILNHTQPPTPSGMGELVIPQAVLDLEYSHNTFIPIAAR